MSTDGNNQQAQACRVCNGGARFGRSERLIICSSSAERAAQGRWLTVCLLASPRQRNKVCAHAGIIQKVAKNAAQQWEAARIRPHHSASEHHVSHACAAPPMQPARGAWARANPLSAGARQAAHRQAGGAPCSRGMRALAADWLQLAPSAGTPSTAGTSSPRGGHTSCTF